jgi:hypothetical protein
MVADATIRYFAGLGWSLVECPPTSCHFPVHRWMLLRPVDAWWAPQGLPFKSIRCLWRWWGEQALRAMQVEALCPLVAEFYKSANDDLRQIILAGLGEKHPQNWTQWGNDFRILEGRAVKARPKLCAGWLHEATSLCLAHEESFHSGMLPDRIMLALTLCQGKLLANGLPRASAACKTGSRL